MSTPRSTLVDAARLERAALDEGREQLHAGWTPNEVVECLVDVIDVIQQLPARVHS